MKTAAELVFSPFSHNVIVAAMLRPCECYSHLHCRSVAGAGDLFNIKPRATVALHPTEVAFFWNFAAALQSALQLPACSPGWDCRTQRCRLKTSKKNSRACYQVPMSTQYRKSRFRKLCTVRTWDKFLDPWCGAAKTGEGKVAGRNRRASEIIHSLDQKSASRLVATFCRKVMSCLLSARPEIFMLYTNRLLLVRKIWVHLSRLYCPAQCKCCTQSNDQALDLCLLELALTCQDSHYDADTRLRIMS